MAGLVVAMAVAASGAVLVAEAAYVQVKAAAAQVLLRAAWARARNGGGGEGRTVRPWPWADTWPVARLAVASLEIDQIVLADAGGESLAFGPSHVAASAPPGTPGITVIGGHRDTHFAWLRRLRLGDAVMLETVSGGLIEYRVDGAAVVPAADVHVEAANESGALVLVTCYRPGARSGRADLRYLVTALPAPVVDGSWSRPDQHALGGPLAWTTARAY